MDRLEFGTSEWAIPDRCLYEYYQSVTSSKKYTEPGDAEGGSGADRVLVGVATRGDTL